MTEALEKMFGKSFPSIRPPWLVSPETGRPLELDAYCEDLSLAAEFQGRQHTEWPNTFHRLQYQFASQQRRDNWRAAELGIRLVAGSDNVPRELMQQYLAEQLPIMMAVVVDEEDVMEEAGGKRVMISKYFSKQTAQ